MARSKSTRINARLDPTLAERLAALQAETGWTLTSILTRSLTRFCDEVDSERGGYAALQRAGFVGCAEGPTDLARTYKAELAPLLDEKLDRGRSRRGRGRRTRAKRSV